MENEDDPVSPNVEPLLPKKPREFGQWEGKVWYAPDYDQADALIQKMFDDEIERDTFLK